MSYIFSRALAEEYLGDNCSGTDAFVLSSGSHTPKPSSLPDKTTAHSRLSRFGQTFKTLTADRGAALLTSFVAAFHVKTSAWPEKGLELTVSAAECGSTLPASLARYDPDTHSLKTAQRLLIEDLTGCCVTLPRSGLMRHGWCSEQVIAMPTMSAKDAGFWPTPTAFGNYNRKGLSATSGDGLATAVQKKMFRTPSSSVIDAKSTVVKLTGRKPSDPQVGLADQVMALERKRTYPTATATAYKGWSPGHNRANKNDRLDYTVEREGFTPGQTTPPMRLNPDWVEWLIGWPIGHTALKPLGTGKFQEWLQQHSIY